MQIPPTTHWIDPRRWAALVRAYALFLAVATVTEYNKIWQVVLESWLPDPKEAANAGILLQPAQVGIFLLPLVASQLLTAGWLLLVRPRQPRADERSLQIAREVLARIWGDRWSYRSPRILVGAVAQPHLVSILGKPFLILPRQGLAYFEHELGPDAENAFRSVIAHEIGHLESWDDLLYFPWFAYTVAGFALCCWGFYLGVIGRLAISQTFNHILILGGLTLLGFYVVRRREAYSDSFSVVTLGSVEATVQALQALGKESKGHKHRWGDTHFDVNTRLTLLSQQGRPFLDMSRIDLGVAAFIYFSLRSTSPLSDLASGGGPFWVLTLWLDALTALALMFLLLLMIGGLSLARGGKSVSLAELGAAGLLCLVSRQISQFLEAGAFNLFHVMMFIMNMLGILVIGLIPFVLVFRVLNLWAVAILGRSGSDARERLVWGASGIVAAFTLLETFTNFGLLLAGRRLMSQGIEGAEALANAPFAEQISTMLPMFLLVLTLWIGKIVLGLLITVWSWLRSRSLPDLICPSCGGSAGSRDHDPRLAIACPSCGANLRRDLVYELLPENPTPC